MRIRVVDAFADRPFTGNPAGVCVLPAGAWPEAAWMQSVAAEMQHAETAFVKPSPDGDAEWELRWFTPTIEVDLCGHATLATTHALLSDGLVSGKVGFSTRSGVLTIPEDPVCGSAHTALAPYWAERLGRNELVGFQASARGGVVRVATVGDRVQLSGQAITTLDGELFV